MADEKWDRADQETVRLQPTHFVGVPEPVKATLSEQGCRIPQLRYTKKPGNLIRGEFMEAGRIQWAALCSRKRPGSRGLWGSARGKFWTSAIIVIDKNGRVRAELASQQDVFSLQGGGQGLGKIGYSRSIDPAGADSILSHFQDHYGQKPPPINHQGIYDSFVEKVSTLYYFHGGKWLEIVGGH